MANIIIFRCGSIGDFVVTLPCLHKVRETFPSDQIVLLSSSHLSPQATPAESVLGNSGLVDQFLYYPPRLLSIAAIIALQKTIRDLAPKTLFYLMPSKGVLHTIKDLIFFKACGVSDIIGMPLSPTLWASLPPKKGSRLWEPLSERLGRQIASVGKIDFKDNKNWDLRLTSWERVEAMKALSPLYTEGKGVRDFFAVSVGTKQAIKDWGVGNWQSVLSKITDIGLPIVFVGANEDWSRSDRLGKTWPHGHLNLCGKTPPRVSAAVLGRAIVFIGLDSGPMHLAASVGTPCVAIFSKMAKPGEWFPHGPSNHILYPFEGDSIMSIEPAAVVAEVRKSFGLAVNVGELSCCFSGNIGRRPLTRGPCLQSSKTP